MEIEGVVHNHGPNEGDGLFCPEIRHPDGSLRGMCMGPVIIKGIPLTHYWDGAKSAVIHDHRVVQHRDGKPPWCPTCGLTEDGFTPVSWFDKNKENKNG